MKLFKLTARSRGGCRKGQKVIQPRSSSPQSQKINLKYKQKIYVYIYV